MTLQERKSKMAANVQDWQTSGLSQVEYARANNIKVATLRYQITRFRQTADEQPAFIQIGGISSQEIHIRYPHGVELILPAQVPAGLLRSLIHI
ncbi:MAG: hypothetical protein EOM90_07385 [Alphaproteobacteria bacterium]|nr:hypothetical protein [Alphaproteobacteria bacterium]